MKNIQKVLMMLAIALTAAAIAVMSGRTKADAASASLNGPQTVRAGDTITLTLQMQAPGSFGVEGILEYDAAVVSYQSMTAEAGGWKAEVSGSKFVIYDDGLTNALGANAGVAKITFQVKANAAAGTSIAISVKELVATDGTNESSAGTAVYRTTVAAPLSSNNNLSSLKVDGVNISPAFSAGTTTYNAGEVDYSVSALNVTAVPQDSKAKVSVSGSSLQVGSNTVSITVTAENGAAKTYRIQVTRKQNPNYVASSDAALASLSISAGVISPNFSTDITEYVVYLPYEISSLSASGQARDSKAQGVTGASADQLEVGAKILSVTCKAEDGTQKTYRITAVRMPQYAGTLPVISGVDTKPTEEDSQEDTQSVADTEQKESSSEQKSTGSGGQKGSGTLRVVLWILLVAVSAGAGFGACYALLKKGIL